MAYHRRYDDWFEHHAAAYHSELLAVRVLLTWCGLGLAIGAGIGRFAAPLGVQVGIDPTRGVLDYTANRRFLTVQAVAEALPLSDSHFDYALSVATRLI